MQPSLGIHEEMQPLEEQRYPTKNANCLEYGGKTKYCPNKGQCGKF